MPAVSRQNHNCITCRKPYQYHLSNLPRCVKGITDMQTFLFHVETALPVSCSSIFLSVMQLMPHLYNQFRKKKKNPKNYSSQQNCLQFYKALQHEGKGLGMFLKKSTCLQQARTLKPLNCTSSSPISVKRNCSHFAQENHQQLLLPVVFSTVAVFWKGLCKTNSWMGYPKCC